MGGGNGGKRGEVSEKSEKVWEQTQTNTKDTRAIGGAKGIALCLNRFANRHLIVRPLRCCNKIINPKTSDLRRMLSDP